jgi:hypothetical protein
MSPQIPNVDAELDAADWAKNTFDLNGVARNEIEFERWLEERSMSVAEFKRLPAYRFAIESGRAPLWLREL